MPQSFKEYLLEAQKTKGEVIEYHDTLNPTIWQSPSALKPKVRTALINIAKEFFEFLKADGYKVIDVYFTGSLANYNYTSKSDVDLHLLVNYEKTDGKACGIDLYDMFNTKKQLWNEQHNITIYDYPVELYVQSESEHLEATGVYSVQDNKWVVEPKHKGALIKDINTYAVHTKVREYKIQIDKLLADKIDDYAYIQKLKDKIKNMRQSGLEKAGEFSVENLAFKKLRNDGYIKKLFDYALKIKDDHLTLEGYTK
jgi:predicted nucleotidyltransferase